MQRFALLLDCLANAQSRNRKIDLLARYFRAAPDPDRGWALAALTDGLPIRIPLRRALTELMEQRVDPVLYGLSRDYVGDTAETVALLWPDVPSADEPPRVGAVVRAVAVAGSAEMAPTIGRCLDALDVRGRWALLKLLGGATRVGVSARLAKAALTAAYGKDIVDIEEVWHAIEPPYESLFAWLEGRAERPDLGAKPVFRPLMLSHPIEERDWLDLNPDDWIAEWKWDGIRVQIAARGGEVRAFSRAADDISRSFPEIVSAFHGLEAVADGELLILRENEIRPFNDLQQRLNRKTVTAKMLEQYPAHVRLYDLLFVEGEDLRELPFIERRRRLEAWHASTRPPLTDLSPLVSFANFAELDTLWAGARQAGIEGLMLKRRESPYLAGRPKGQWWKWKRAPMTLDCVLMYAQRGSGKRSSFYSDYTFGVWKENDQHQDAVPQRELVPVGKAYSGFTDEELRRLDRWIREHVVDRYGPVLAVEPGLVLEVAFDAVHPSTRHKSGVAMRFPRVHRIRWDKPAGEADTLATVIGLFEQKPAAA